MLPFQIGRIFFRDCLFSTEASRCQLLSKWHAEAAFKEDSPGIQVIQAPQSPAQLEHLELRICFGFRHSDFGFSFYIFFNASFTRSSAVFASPFSCKSCTILWASICL